MPQRSPASPANERDKPPASDTTAFPHRRARAHDLMDGPAVQGAIREAGHPIHSATAARFQMAFGHDLSAVRVHTGDRAAASAAFLGARAYTVGRHVVFGRGEYAPATAAGRRLIGHELAHVIQQSRAGSATPAQAPSLQAAADYAADRATNGYPVRVSGASMLGIARQTIFDLFTGGKYSWPLLKRAITEGARPAETIVADINGLSPSEREQAIKDVTQERITQFRKLTDLTGKRAKQADPALKTVSDPPIDHVKAVTAKADQILDGLFEAVATSETAASLKSGTVAPAAADKPLIDSALKPDLRPNEQFAENLPGDPVSYIDKLRDVMPKIIDSYHMRMVDNRGKTEHDDPAKVHSLSEFERIGGASQSETDKVFGQYKKGPPLKADTRKSRGNLHDLFAETDKQLKGMNADEKRDQARWRIAYFFQTTREVADINRAHSASPKFTPPVNPEAADQQLVTTEVLALPDEVKRLNEISRGWPASEQAGGVNIQVFRKPDETSGPLAGPNVADRDFLWDMFQALIHEYIHTLRSGDYSTYAASFGYESNQYNTLIEGVDTLLDEVVWSEVAPHVTDPALRQVVEGPVYSALPPINVLPASRRRYASYAQAVKLVNIVGIRNLYAAYFLGDVKKIKGGP